MTGEADVGPMCLAGATREKAYSLILYLGISTRATQLMAIAQIRYCGVQYDGHDKSQKRIASREISRAASPLIGKGPSRFTVFQSNLNCDPFCAPAAQSAVKSRERRRRL